MSWGLYPVSFRNYFCQSLSEEEEEDEELSFRCFFASLLPYFFWAGLSSRLLSFYPSLPCFYYFLPSLALRAIFFSLASTLLGFLA